MHWTHEASMKPEQRHQMIQHQVYLTPLKTPSTNQHQTQINQHIGLAFSKVDNL